MNPIPASIAVLCMALYAWMAPDLLVHTRAHSPCTANPHHPAQEGQTAHVDYIETAEAGACACKATYTSSVPGTLTGCNNPPFIEPSFPSAVDGPCGSREGGSGDDGGCIEIADAKCSATVNVRVTFPSNGNSCHSVCIMGGNAYPNPTQVNVTSLTSTLAATSRCGMTAPTSPGSAAFYIWKSQPQLNSDGTAQVDGNGDPVTKADAKYIFSVACEACKKKN